MRFIHIRPDVRVVCAGKILTERGNHLTRSVIIFRHFDRTKFGPQLITNVTPKFVTISKQIMIFKSKNCDDFLM